MALLLTTSLTCGALAAPSSAAAPVPKNINSEVGGLFVPASRSELVVVPQDIAEVIIADPDIADVHVIGAKRVAFIGKKIGRTNAKLFDKNNKVIRQFDVVVGYDLPAIRKALHFFLPHERIGVELVNTNIALIGEVSDATAADKALKVVDQFVRPPQATATAAAGGAVATATPSPILNMMKVVSGQQVMLHVRIGEIQRNALKQLGVELAGQLTGANVAFGSQGGQQSFETGTTTPFPGLTVPSADLTSGGLISGVIRSSAGGLSAALNALETEGLLRILAEPDLVAMSGERAEFLSGGEFPVPTIQSGSSGTAPITTVQFQQFGVAVQFVPYVLSDNRIRLNVQPEVSQIDASESTTVNGTVIPGLDTRRAKTTVELAPGETFMIAGLLQDNLNSSISQVPGASEIPILGSLLRNTSYTRNETELVIAVTPYLVDPLKASDIRMPTDDFRPASVMEQFFYGTLGAMSGNSYRLSQTPSVEGPLGFMTD
jgi:pilus assembly protein CpaC